MMAYTQRLKLSIYVLAMLCWHVGANAEIPGQESQKSQEIRVFANALKYFSGIGKGSDSYVVGVIYSPDVTSSRTEAEEYTTEMNRSDSAQKARLKAKMLPVAELKNSGVNIVYLGPDLYNLYPEIYPIAKASNMFVYSHDAECVRQELCPLSIRIDSTLEIFLSEVAIRDFNFGVDPMLRLMVKRLEK